MSEQIHLTRKERSVYFYKLLLMYAVGVVLLSAILFWNARGKTVAGPEWKQRFAERESYTKTQIQALQLIDSMLTKMAMLKGDARQTFIQQDIQDMVKELAGLYGDGSQYDARALSFVQASHFMRLRLEDILVLNTEKENVARFERQLQNCKAGYSVSSASSTISADR